MKNKPFNYLGMEYKPVREFTDKEMEPFNHLCFSEASTPPGYDYKEFYKASGFAEFDVFLCSGSGEMCVPCNRGMYVFKK